MHRVPLSIVLSVALGPALTAPGQVEVEPFDGGVFTNPVFNHDFEFNDPCCWEIVFRGDVGSHMLHLRPNSDFVTFNLQPGQFVDAISVLVLDYEGGFVGTLPASAVIVRAASGDFVALHASALGVPEVVSADSTTIGQLTGEPLGRIVSIRLDAANEGNALFPTEFGGYFDDVTINVSQGLVGDINGDGVVDVQDLLLLFADWGPCPGPPFPCPSDINGDGTIDVQDLLMLFANWT